MIKDIDKMNKLIDAYENLLTEHQRNVIKMYYEDDFSLQEISEEISSSRSAVSDLIKRVEKILLDYESKLHLVEIEDTKYVIIMTAGDNPVVMNSIKETLINKKIAACVQSVDITSSYRWNGKVHNEKEKLLLIKTKKSEFEQAKDIILSLHNYEVPEIVMVNIEDGNEDYFKWIDEEVGE